MHTVGVVVDLRSNVGRPSIRGGRRRHRLLFLHGGAARNDD
jgi:hypothetical protein